MRAGSRCERSAVTARRHAPRLALGVRGAGKLRYWRHQKSLNLRNGGRQWHRDDRRLLLRRWTAGGGLSACAPATGGASSRSAAANIRSPRGPADRDAATGPAAACSRSSRRDGCANGALGERLRHQLRRRRVASGSGRTPPQQPRVKIAWTGEVSDQYVCSARPSCREHHGGLRAAIVGQRLDLNPMGQPVGV
jgi:hypothetical protein